MLQRIEAEVDQIRGLRMAEHSNDPALLAKAVKHSCSSPRRSENGKPGIENENGEPANWGTRPIDRFSILHSRFRRFPFSSPCSRAQPRQRRLPRPPQFRQTAINQRTDDQAPATHLAQYRERHVGGPSQLTQTGEG